MKQHEEKILDGVIIRRSTAYPKMWAAQDGRIAGARGHWLSPAVVKHGYLRLNYIDNGKRINVFAHRIVADAWLENDDPINNTQVDHLDGITANNAVSNLKWTTPRMNSYNKVCHREGTKSSRYYGVSWNDARNRWHAAIRVGGRNVSLKTFIREKDAALAVDRALVELGEKPVNGFLPT